MEPLGFIGTGVMEFPMARNLVRHFGKLVVCSPQPSTADMVGVLRAIEARNR